MIERRLKQQLQQRLAQFPAVALLGPRQVGKTTLAKSLSLENSLYLDLENPEDAEKLSDPLTYLSAFPNQLVVIDEIQRSPDLFQVLRSIIDDRIEHGKPAGHFLLLGSASIDLLKQSSETLAGRIAYLELCPLDCLEIHSDNLLELWNRGGFPLSFLAPNDEASQVWRDSFITTYLERDIPQLGPRIPSETLRRFWTMLAHSQGSLLNAAELAKSLAVSGKTIANYLDLMVDLLLVRRLAPYHANVNKRLVKSPKVYVRDTGLVHSLLRLDSLNQVLGHPIAGMSWEGFVIEQLLRVAPPRTQASFYRTSAGAEVDLILELPGNQCWAIEIKRGLAPKVEKGFHHALEDIQPSKAFVVYGGEERYPKGSTIEAISLPDLAFELTQVSAK